LLAGLYRTVKQYIIENDAAVTQGQNDDTLGYQKYLFAKLFLSD
jgi:hypothetical protein